MDKTICCILQDAKTRTVPIYRIQQTCWKDLTHNLKEPA